MCLAGAAIAVILLDLVIARKGILRFVSIAALAACIVVSIALWSRQDNDLFNGMIKVDQFAIFFKVLLSGVAILVLLASKDYVSKFSRFEGEYYALILLSVVGMMLMAASRDLITIYVSLELTSISLYALVGFLTGGFGFKISSVPFQMWVPDVYEGAPTTVTAYLSVASKAAGFAVILRVFLEAFGGDILPDWAMIFAVLGAISMTLGNVIAISQNTIKRMLGYSSMAQAGYLMVGLAAATRVEGVGDPALFGPTGLVFFLGCYALANLGAFIAIIAITNKTNSDAIDAFAGMGSRAPVISLALTLCLISLTGVPPTAGFLAKLYLFNAAVHHDLVWLVIIGVINSAISAYYYLRVVKATWFGSPASTERVPSSLALRLALAVACAGVLVLFFYPSPLLDVARDAAQSVAGAVLPDRK